MSAQALFFMFSGYAFWASVVLATGMVLIDEVCKRRGGKP